MLRIIKVAFVGNIWHYIATSERYCIDDEDSYNRAVCLLPGKREPPDETEVEVSNG